MRWKNLCFQGQLAADLGRGSGSARWRLERVKGIELAVTAGRRLGLIILLERQATRDLCQIAHANRSVLPPAQACVPPLDLEVIRTWRAPMVQQGRTRQSSLGYPLWLPLSVKYRPPKVIFYLIQQDSITQTVLTTQLSHCFRTRLHQICVRQKRQNSDFQGVKTLYLSFS